MTYILNIYMKDKRTRSGKRIVGSYEYDRKDMESMLREVKELYPVCKAEDGYTFEIIEPE